MYKVELDRFNNYIIKSTTKEGEGVAWEAAVEILIASCNKRKLIWGNYT